MNWFKKNCCNPSSQKFRFRTILVVPFVLQIVAAVGLVGYLSYKSGYEAVEELANHLMSEAGNRVFLYLTDYLKIPVVINRLNANAVELGQLDTNDLSKSERYLTLQNQQFPEVYGLQVINAQGDFMSPGLFGHSPPLWWGVLVADGSDKSNYRIYKVDSAGNRAQLVESFKNLPPKERLPYKTAVAAKQATWTPIYQSIVAKDLLIAAVLPLYDHTTGELRAVLGSLISLSFTQFLETVKISPGARIYIAEPNGSLVTNSTRESVFREDKDNNNNELKRITLFDNPSPILTAAGQQIRQHIGDLNQLQSSRQLILQIQKEAYFLKVIPFRDELGLQLSIIVIIPELDFLAQIYQNTQRTILLCLLAMCIAIVVGLFTTRWIIRPIRQMTRASEHMADGDLDQHVRSSRIIELDKLGKSFNRMTGQLKESFAALCKSEEALRLANEELEKRVEQRTAELRQEKERSEELLLNILPAEIAERLKQSNEYPAEHFEQATILFADIVGFTDLSTRLEPMQLVNGLNQIFSAFDQLTEKYGLEKIKTIGDAYMVVGGLPIPRPDHAIAIANMALEMQAHMQTLNEIMGESLQIRIGINTGPVIAGVIGIKKFIYDLWGDAVNVASRMESHGQPGHIQVTDVTYTLLKEQYVLEPRGTIFVKGRGDMATYWLLGRRMQEV